MRPFIAIVHSICARWKDRSDSAKHTLPSKLLQRILSIPIGWKNQWKYNVQIDSYSSIPHRTVGVSIRNCQTQRLECKTTKGSSEYKSCGAFRDYLSFIHASRLLYGRCVHRCNDNHAKISPRWSWLDRYWIHVSSNTFSVDRFNLIEWNIDDSCYSCNYSWKTRVFWKRCLMNCSDSSPSE